MLRKPGARVLREKSGKKKGTAEDTDGGKGPRIETDKLKKK
jgi:hypothetical protein